MILGSPTTWPSEHMNSSKFVYIPMPWLATLPLSNMLVPCDRDRWCIGWIDTSCIDHSQTLAWFSSMHVQEMWLVLARVKSILKLCMSFLSLCNQCNANTDPTYWFFDQGLLIQLCIVGSLDQLWVLLTCYS